MRRQAVLLIHGIGEQKPMQTLRSFVNAVWTTNTAVQRNHPRAGQIWSKPYPLSEDFELRRLTTAENRAGIYTDFFEFYWAHKMQGATLGHVWAWAKTLLLRNPSTVPRQLRLAYWTLWALLAVALAGAAAAGIFTASADRKPIPAWLSLLMTVVVLPAVVGLLKAVVGDAARYLHVAPGNVQRRHAIRSAGVKTLRSLHLRNYDRIIVVGHSLGSVIGYDILCHAWTHYNTDAPKVENPSYEALDELERLAATAGDTVAIQAAQRRYFDELKANGARWRVTDFITLGSPLAHAEILLAENAEDLKAKCRDREFATCLPFLEETQRHGETLLRFSFPPGEDRRVPHHAAVFGPTRWTNLYFPNRLLAVGDLIGGPLGPVFGPGVKDVAVRTDQWRGLFSHTLYWSLGKSESHVEELRKVLDLLDSGKG